MNSERNSAPKIHCFTSQVGAKDSLCCDLLRWLERKINSNFHVPSVFCCTVADPLGSKSDDSEASKKGNKTRDRSPHVEIE